MLRATCYTCLKYHISTYISDIHWTEHLTYMYRNLAPTGFPIMSNSVKWPGFISCTSDFSLNGKNIRIGKCFKKLYLLCSFYSKMAEYTFDKIFWQLWKIPLKILEFLNISFELCNLKKNKSFVEWKPSKFSERGQNQKVLHYKLRTLKTKFSRFSEFHKNVCQISINILIH